ncbi:MAG: HNH endonuclease signature motif containing protein [Terracidiphilus sp.]
MWTLILVAAAVLATARISKAAAERRRKKEDAARYQRWQGHLARENALLRREPDESSPFNDPEKALASLGNVAYLIWFLRFEKRHRDDRGDGSDQYPPDWDWRRRFVFMRDSFQCQGCGTSDIEGIGLDCHHIRPISKFHGGEKGVHALSNLITLCPACHASQHLGNVMLAERVRKSWNKNFGWVRASDRRNSKSPPKIWSTVRIDPPVNVDIHPSLLPDGTPQEIGRPTNQSAQKGSVQLPLESASPASENPMRVQNESVLDRNINLCPPPKAKNITEGLDIIDQQIANARISDYSQPHPALSEKRSDPFLPTSTSEHLTEKSCPDHRASVKAANLQIADDLLKLEKQLMDLEKQLDDTKANQALHRAFLRHRIAVIKDAIFTYSNHLT